jgi:dTDP-4-amino-4,6-dideoxygalactose transaminase
VRAALAGTFDARHTVLTDSGTTALALALRIVAGPEASVALPAYSCIDLITAAQSADVRVRLYDVEPSTLSPNLDSLRLAASRGVRAIVVAPLFGYPIDYAGVESIAEEHGIPVIEDAAQAAGATLGGRRVGSFGVLTVLSFARGKGTTGGSGGALLVRDSRYTEAAVAVEAGLERRGRGARDVFALGAQWSVGRPLLYRLPSSIPALRLGEMVYHPPHAPHDMSDAAVTMLHDAIGADAAEVVVRRERAEELGRLTAGSARFTAVGTVANGTPGFLRMAFIDKTGTATPCARIGALRTYPVTLDEHSETRKVLLDGEAAGAGARELRDRLFTVPTHSRLHSADIRTIAEWVNGKVRNGTA